MCLGPRKFTGDARRLSEAADVDRSRVNTPPPGQHGDAVSVLAERIALQISGWLRCLGVFKAAQAEFRFCRGLRALVPNRFSSPCVTADYSPALQVDPGMVVYDAISAEKLDLPNFSAEG